MKENFDEMIVLKEHGQDYFRNLKIWAKKGVNVATFDEAQPKKKSKIEVLKKIIKYHAEEEGDGDNNDDDDQDNQDK